MPDLPHPETSGYRRLSWCQAFYDATTLAGARRRCATIERKAHDLLDMIREQADADEARDETNSPEEENP
jgi:hypothetical protein